MWRLFLDYLVCRLNIYPVWLWFYIFSEKTIKLSNKGVRAMGEITFFYSLLMYLVWKISLLFDLDDSDIGEDQMRMNSSKLIFKIIIRNEKIWKKKRRENDYQWGVQFGIILLAPWCQSRPLGLRLGWLNPVPFSQKGPRALSVGKRTLFWPWALRLAASLLERQAWLSLSCWHFYWRRQKLSWSHTVMTRRRF